jgi:hypothetical protein
MERITGIQRHTHTAERRGRASKEYRKGTGEDREGKEQARNHAERRSPALTKDNHMLIYVHDLEHGQQGPEDTGEDSHKEQEQHRRQLVQ